MGPGVKVEIIVCLGKGDGVSVNDKLVDVETRVGEVTKGRCVPVGTGVVAGAQAANVMAKSTIMIWVFIDLPPFLESAAFLFCPVVYGESTFSPREISSTDYRRNCLVRK